MAARKPLGRGRPRVGPSKARTPSLAPGEACVVCGAPAVHNHHVLPRHDVLSHYGGDAGDRRGVIALCFDDHFRHEYAVRRVDLRLLPDSVFEFAVELMGPGAAYEFLRRDYAGEDPRLTALLIKAGYDPAEGDGP